MQPLQYSASLNADRRAKACVPRFQAFRVHNPNRDFLGSKRLPRCEAESVETEPRQFIATEILPARVAATGLDGLGIKVCAQHPQRTVDVRQIGPALIEFLFQFRNVSG